MRLSVRLSCLKPKIFGEKLSSAPRSTSFIKHECASVHIVKQQTATFQTKGPGSVHLYATHHILTCFIHVDVYNLDIRLLTYTPV